MERVEPDQGHPGENPWEGYEVWLAELEWQLEAAGTDSAGRLYHRLRQEADRDPDPARAARARGRGAARLARAHYACGQRVDGDNYLAELEALLATQSEDRDLTLALAETLAAAVDLLGDRLTPAEQLDYAAGLERLSGPEPDGELAPFAGLALEARSASLLEAGDLGGLQVAFADISALVHAVPGSETADPGLCASPPDRSGALRRAELRVGCRLVVALCAAGRLSEAGLHLGALERSARPFLAPEAPSDRGVDEGSDDRSKDATQVAADLDGARRALRLAARSGGA